MAGCNRIDAVASIRANLVKRIKEENPGLKAVDIRAMAKEAADSIVDKVSNNVANTFEAELSPAVSDNASTEAVPTELPEHTVSGDVVALAEDFKANPSNESKSALLNAETAAGMRNADGEMIVEAVPPRTNAELREVVGSEPLKTPMTHEELSDFYYDQDGSMSNADNVNNALKELDKTNFGEDLDTEWSEELDSTLAAITAMVGDIGKAELKIKKTTLERAAKGQFNPNTGEIEVKLDNLGTGTEARNKFTMTNQEVYVHEVVHAVVDYAFEEENLKAGKNTDLVNLISESKRLYNIARKNTSWRDLLVDISYPTKQEIADAKERYEYIFNNPHGNGLHEFMAHLLTNKQFAKAMSQVEAGVQTKDARTAARKAADIKEGKGITRADESADMITKIQAYFRGLLNSILGFATAREGNITDAGSKLIFKIVQANVRAADTVSDNQVIKIAQKSATFLEKQLDKVNETLNKVDEKLQKPIEDAVNAALGRLNTKASKRRLKEEVARQKAKFYKQVKADTEEKRKAVEVQADIAATAAAEEYIAKEGLRVMAAISKASKKIKEQSAKEEAAPKSKIYGVDPFKSMLGIPRKLLLLNSLRKVSKGTYGADLAEVYAAEYKKLYDKLDIMQGSFLASILEDYYEKDDLYNEITDAILALTHKVDGEREAIYEGVLADVGSWFGDIKIHSKPYKGFDAAMTDVILRTDIQALDVDAKGLLGLLTNPDKIEARIVSLKDKLTKEQVEDAVSTAEYLATGVGTVSNATNIARGFGHGKVKATDQVSADLVGDIDSLVSLIALQKASKDSKSTMVDFLTGKGYDEYIAALEKRLGSKLRVSNTNKLTESEYKDQIFAGVDQMIGHARGMQNGSAIEMKDDPHNIIKGYMKETYDKRVTLGFFPMDMRKEKEIEGYEFIRTTESLASGSKPIGMFIIKDTNVKKVNGALGLQSSGQRGATLWDSILADNPGIDNFQARAMFKKELDKAIEVYAGKDRSKKMFPVYNENGDIINFRATMHNDDKHKLLKVEERASQNLARSYGTTSGAAKTARHNEGIVTRLFEDFNENYVGNEADYVTIEPDTVLGADNYGLVSESEVESEVGYSKMWARLPQSTKDKATKLFGDGKIIIRKDLILPMFGYDEVTAANSSFGEKLSAKNRRRLRAIEQGIQDTMQIAKANIVIKTTGVIIGNLTSNAKILFYLGVNPIKGTKLMLLAQKELTRYEDNKKELARLEREALSGINSHATRIRALKTEIARNSVDPLIQAGLYQSVVEDVSYKTDTNRVSEWFNDKRDKHVTNETANTALQYLFLTEKTKPYQTLLKVTQVSDFYFRYAQYYDAIENKGHSTEKAMRDVTDNYINYEAPLNKYVKYGDRMGPFFFITYFTRIQKVIRKIVKSNPGRVGLDIAQQFITSDQADILDTSFMDASVVDHYNPFKIFGNLWQVISPSGLELPGIIGK